ncbi:MAG: glycosyltransferase family 39 protein [Anaerolineae bacterium]
MSSPQLIRNRWLEAILFVLVLVAGATLRWYGLGWDAGYLFHPDERQIAMVASNLDWPHSLSEFFSPSSPLNPHFFAYGSFPIYLLRLIAPFAPPSNLTGPWANDFLARWIVFGRAISGLFDLGTICLTYALGKRVYGSWVGLAAAAGISVTVLHIQLAHFYTVDTVLTFFVMATLYAAWRMGEISKGAHPAGALFERKKWPLPRDPGPGDSHGSPSHNRWGMVCGVMLGLALATKVSALPLVAPIAFAIWHVSGARIPPGTIRVKIIYIWGILRRPLCQLGGIALAVFIVTQPYAVIDGIQFVIAVGREGLVARGWLDYPYTRQYANTIPFLYQIAQSAIWGMGLPLGIVVWGGGALFLYQAYRKRDGASLFLLFWALVYFLAIGAQYVKYPRYLLPLLPVLYLMAARAISTGALVNRGWGRVIVGVGTMAVLTLSLVYAFAFVSTYGREHPWLTVSRWMFENVQPGATLAIEQWDDALPVQASVDGVVRTGSEYPALTLPIQDPDDENKRNSLAQTLARADVVVIASQRGYGSVGRLADRYPLTVRYYQKLFNGELGYTLAATARNDIQIGDWQITDNPWQGLPFATSIPLASGTRALWNWGFADESLTVYDHPQPLIFVKTRPLTQSELREALGK